MTEQTTQSLHDDDFTPPEGFKPFPPADHFPQLVGPLYLKMIDKELKFGFRVEQRHCNPGNVCHGGMLMTVLDMVVGTAIATQTGKFGMTPTINMSFDFLAPAPRGVWLESRLEFAQARTRMGFANAYLDGPDGPVIRANGIVKIPSQQRADFKAFSLHDAAKNSG